jgi:hypothetical protein
LLASINPPRTISGRLLWSPKPVTNVVPRVATLRFTGLLACHRSVSLQGGGHGLFGL